MSAMHLTKQKLVDRLQGEKRVKMWDQNVKIRFIIVTQASENRLVFKEQGLKSKIIECFRA